MSEETAPVHRRSLILEIVRRERCTPTDLAHALEPHCPQYGSTKLHDGIVRVVHEHAHAVGWSLKAIEARLSGYVSPRSAERALELNAVADALRALLDDGTIRLETYTTPAKNGTSELKGVLRAAPPSLASAINDFAAFGLKLCGTWAELGDEYQRLWRTVETTWAVIRPRMLPNPAHFPPEHVASFHARLNELANEVRKYAERQSGPWNHFGGGPHPMKVIQQLRNELVSAATVFEERLALVDGATRQATGDLMPASSKMPNDDAMLDAKAIAHICGLRVNTANQRLVRHRQKSTVGVVTLENRARQESKYLHRWGAVKHLFPASNQSDEASPQRPTKKKKGQETP